MFPYLLTIEQMSRFEVEYQDYIKFKLIFFQQFKTEEKKYLKNKLKKYTKVASINTCY